MGPRLSVCEKMGSLERRYFFRCRGRHKLVDTCSILAAQSLNRSFLSSNPPYRISWEEDGDSGCPSSSAPLPHHIVYDIMQLRAQWVYVRHSSRSFAGKVLRIVGAAYAAIHRDLGIGAQRARHV